MAIRLKQAGIDDFVLLEREDDVGGTWHVNTYPGCQCDVPSHLYSFSFAPNPDWSRTYSRQEEIWRYLRDCAERFGILRTSASATRSARPRGTTSARRWRIDTSQGELEAQVLVGGFGALVEPQLPNIPGMAELRGHRLPLGPLEPRPRPDRRARGLDRHRGVGDPVRAAHPAAGGAAARLPAHAAVDHAPQRPAGHRARAPGLPPLPALQRLVRAGVYWGREWLVLGFTRDRRLMKADRARSRGAT